MSRPLVTRTGVRVPPVLTCSVSVVASTCCGRDGVVTRSAMQWSSLGKNTVSRVVQRTTHGKPVKCSVARESKRLFQVRAKYVSHIHTYMRGKTIQKHTEASTVVSKSNHRRVGGAGGGGPTTSRLVAFEGHGTLIAGFEAQCVRYPFVVVCLCGIH